MENKNEPIRIAQIIGKWLGGGVESVVMNYYRHIDRSKIQFDFICDEDSTNIPYEEIEGLGGRVILVPPYQHVFRYQKELKKIFKKEQYTIVHSHINALSIFPLYVARKTEINVRIAHSHSTTNKKEWKKNIVKNMLKHFSKVYATDYFSCTEHAGRWLFGNETFDKGEVYVLNNAIDLSKFKYNEQIRRIKRKELGIDENTFVIGHIGRFVPQKNHQYLIKIFSELHKKNKNSILVLVGQGPLQDAIQEKVNKMGLANSVKFLGQREDVNELYQVFDIFLLPSLYEGLGVVLIESQCAGCFSITSSEVPSVVKVTPFIEFINLSESPKVWAEAIIKYEKSKNRIDLSENISIQGYDINIEVKKIEDFYFQKFNNIKN